MSLMKKATRNMDSIGGICAFKWVLVLIVLSCLNKHFTASQCTWPGNFQNTIWVDSDKGELTFGTTSMSGWTLVFTTGNVTSWNCYLVNGTVLILKSSSTIQLFTQTITVYLCWSMTQVSAYAYYYYQMSSEQPRAEYQRVRMVANSDTTFTGSMSDICTETPNTAEYHVLLKHVALSSVKQICPTPFLGTFSYSYNNGTTSLCGSGNELLDVCTDRQSMYINKTVCGANVGYSNGGEIVCVVTISSGSNYFVTVYNTDLAVDESTFYKFTCFMAAVSGQNVIVSQSPRSCTKTQSPNNVPVNTAGVTVGATLTLIPFTTCPLTNQTATSSATSGSSINVALIVGSVAGGLVVIVVSIVIIIICKKKASKSTNSSDQMKTCLICSDEVVEHPSNTVTSQRLFVSMATMTDISMVEFRAENTNETVVEELPSRSGTSSATLPPLSPVPSEDEHIYHSRNGTVIGIRTENIDVTSTDGQDEQDYTNEHYGLHPHDGELSLDDPGPGASNDKVKVIHLPLTSQDTRHGTEGVKDNHEMRDASQPMEDVDGSANISFPVGSHAGQDSLHIRRTNAEQGYLSARSSQLAVVVGEEQEESTQRVLGDGQTSEMTQARNNQHTFETLQDGQVSQPLEQINTPVLNNGRTLSHITVNQAEQITSNSQIGGSKLPTTAPGKTEQSSASIIYDEQGSAQMMLVHEQTRQTDHTISQMIAEHVKEPGSTSGAQNRNQASSRLEDSSSNLRFVSKGATQHLREIDTVLVHSITNTVLSELRQQGLLKTANISIEPKYVAGEIGGISSQTQNSQFLSQGQRVSNVSRPVSLEGPFKRTNEKSTCVTGGNALIQRETTGPMLSYRKSNVSLSHEPRFPLGPEVEFRQLKENWQFERGTFVKEFSKNVSSATIITNLEDSNIPGQPLYD